MATLTSLLVISFALFFACVLATIDHTPVQAGPTPGSTEANRAQAPSAQSIKGMLRSGPSPRGSDDPPPRSPPPSTQSLKGMLRSGPSPRGPDDPPPRGPPPHTFFKDPHANAPQVLSARKGLVRSETPQEVP